MSRALSLPVAAGGSVALHAGFAGLALLLAVPDGVTPQRPPESQLAVEAYQVERSEAAEAAPDTEAAAEDEARPDAAAEGAVPQSRATPAEAPAETAAAVAPPAERAAASEAPAEVAAAAPAPTEAAAPVAPPGDTIAAAPPPEAAALPSAAFAPAEAVAATPEAPVVVAAAAPPAEPAGAATLDAPKVRPADPAPAPVVAAAAPPAEAAVPATPPAAAAAPVAPPAADLAAAAPDAAAAPPVAADAPAAAAGDTAGLPAADLPPPAEKGRATLAPIGPDGELDPKSLEAIAAFTRPEDAADSAAEVRDGIEGLLASVPCSRLQVAFDPDSGTLKLTGHIPDDGLRAPVLAALEGQIGAGIPVEADLRILPRPQCGALDGIGEVGLPQSNELGGNPRIIGADGFVSEERYRRGQFVHFTMEGLDYDAYVYVDYFAADGQVYHLVPNQTVALKVLPKGASFRVGSDDPGEGEVRLEVGPPYGQEIAVAFASSVPLYDGLRPLAETADAYLADLQRLVAEARAATPDFKGEWVYFFIATSE